MALVKFIDNPKSLNLEDFKSIKSMTLGPNWMAAPLHKTFSITQQAFNYRRGEPTIMLVSRTQSLNPRETAALKGIRQHGTHQISSTEWKALGSALGEQLDHNVFSLKISEVIDWNGKLVIHNEGDYHEFGLRTFSLFIDVDDTGRFVEEVIYQSPIPQYDAYVSEAMIAIQSIEWHSLHSFLK